MIECCVPEFYYLNFAHKYDSQEGVSYFKYQKKRKEKKELQRKENDITKLFSALVSEFELVGELISV